jgi:hypothetical protein
MRRLENDRAEPGQRPRNAPGDAVGHPVGRRHQGRVGSADVVAMGNATPGMALQFAALPMAAVVRRHFTRAARAAEPGVRRFEHLALPVHWQHRAVICAMAFALGRQ